MSKYKYLVDADTIIDFFNGRTELFHLFDEVEDIAVSVVSSGEIYAYAEKSGRENAASISKDFCSQIEQLPVTAELCEKFSALKGEAQKKNILVSDNKIWVAATAVFYNLVLVSDNSAFDCFHDLKRMNYKDLQNCGTDR